jgi:hypothetical protein
MANLDIVSPAGTVEGWALDQGSDVPCHVQVRLNDEIVAEDVADRFRPDLLQAGLRHGHCAFYARMKQLAVGHYPLRLFDGRSGEPIGYEPLDLFFVPEFALQVGRQLEDVLRPRDRWVEKDLLSYPAGLPLQQTYESFGARRFVDRVFQFVLGRWADAEGCAHYIEMLGGGHMTPEQVFITVLGSEERRNQTRPLPRPMDPDFPFVYQFASEIDPEPGHDSMP